jgi:hypothetical protein
MNHRPANPYSHSSSIGSGQKASIEGQRSEVFRVYKLPFFPALEKDESLYSICARFHRLSGYRDSEITSELMFGYRNGGARQENSLALWHLAEATGRVIPPTEKTIRERTVLRSYLPFMRPVQRQVVLRNLLTPQTEPLNRAKAGLTWNAVTVTHELRACPECVDQQLREIGFAYWRTSHQLPGVWVCTEHKQPLWAQRRRGPRNLAWIDVHSAHLSPTPLATSVESLRQLTRLADCLAWLANRSTIDLDALAALVRFRLHQGGCTQSEVKLSDDEQRDLLNAFRAAYVLTGIDHLGFLDSPKWLHLTLRDKRAAHPVRWAVMLAATGSTSPAELTVQYDEALCRLPELELFDERLAPRLARAPSSLYTVFADPVSLAEAAKRTRMPLPHVHAWMRRDAGLVQHRREASATVKFRAALLTIQGAVAATPAAKRSEIIARCLWAVRWLEANAPDELNKALPPTQAMFDPQLRLDFGMAGPDA